MIPIQALPTVNAMLNGASAVLLLTGYLYIRRGKVGAHRALMGSACFTSTLFLVSYLIYHYHAGSRHFVGTGIIRKAYFSILISHTFLAAVIVPMVIVTLGRALRGNFQSHRGIARWTLPLWIYVSITGVVIYWMLYHF